ncbi:insulin-like 3 (Leydig cell) [Salminus brasiliensis]|uniref:insulin-like 3 (Leydig cell) n=1 Tax=Salminus brasiliensis TaxID=930266 RepID=UPI003B8325E5
MNMKWLVILSVFLVVGGESPDGEDTRLKLCGREFIRMVVTSCGSSRLRRSVLDFNHLKQISIGQILSTADDRRPGESSTERGAENRTAETNTRQSSRTPRNVGPAGVCCRSGCTMSELVQYC